MTRSCLLRSLGRSARQRPPIGFFISNSRDRAGTSDLSVVACPGDRTITPSGASANFCRLSWRDERAGDGSLHCESCRADSRNMTVVFLASLIGGLLLAVRIMILGVERPPERSPTGERSFRLSPPIIVAFMVVFGISGYLLVRRTSMSPLQSAGVAIALGAGASAV